jgi:hypothetical protein
MITFSPDKFGFYEVTIQDRVVFTTYSKLEAIETHRRLGFGHIRWNFNRDVYSAIDWTKEPETGLWEMYKMRARQIREHYDYVVLWYSGGSDSHNILHAFLDADVKFDEIATTWNYEASGDKHNHYNAEINTVVLPDVKKLQDAGHDFKFRLVDISQLCIDLFPTWGTDFEYNVNFHFSPNNPAKHLLREKIQDYKDIIASGKKLCFVWGKEKPAIQFAENKHSVQFIDNVDNCVGPYVQKNYHKGWYDELFYWTPDFPLIPVKQAHVVMNYIKNAPESDFDDNPKVFQQTGYSNKYNKYLREDVFKTVLYPKWSNLIFCNGKSNSFTYSLRDDWFFTGNNDHKKRFIDITNSYFNLVNPTDKERRRLPPYFERHWLE